MLFVTLLVAAAVASSSAELVRMEPSVNTFSSSKWLKEKTISDSDMVSAVFVLKHDSAATKAFEAKLLDISTPKSKNYAKWMTHDEIKAAIGPSDEKVKIVTDYLAKFGVKGRVSRLNDMIHVKMPAKIANSVFNTEFANFRSLTERGVVLPRITKPYSLPSEVAEVVSIVDDIMRFPAMRDSPKSYGVDTTPLSADDEFSSCGKDCSGNTTPDVLASAYSFSTPVANVAAGNSMSVAEFQYQYWDQADLTAFNGACGSEASVTTTVGGNSERICEMGGCVEALLDIEYIGAVAAPIPLTVIYSSTYSLLDWVDQVIAMDDAPLVHSVSYGNDEVQQTSTEYMESVNTQFAAAGALGLSILFASGDQGVWGRSGVGKTFHPDFPAGSPYVTAVGGTDFSTKSSIGQESVWSCGGGGFSDTFATPSWQADVVANYLSVSSAAGTLPEADKFNATGRGYPDISALGGQVNPYCVAVRGGKKFEGVAGTSASCPVAAGIFAQLNNVRLAAGKPALGWLNPFIYANPQCFNDVSDGSQNNCNAGTTGFSTHVGWDAATGLGSPNYECLSKVVNDY